MTRTLVLPLLAAFLACPAFAFEYRSSHFLDRIRNSREILYADVVRYYDSLLTARSSAVIHIEKCKFMESALYDPETEENPKAEEWDSCYRSLLARHPLDARVAAYRIAHLYGDSVVVQGELAVERAGTGLLAGADDQTMAAIHQSLAVAYADQDSARLALTACFAALKLVDTIPVHLLIAQQWAALGNGAEARKALLRGESRFQAWENNQAADLLLELGYARDAEQLYRKNMADSTLYTNYGGLAKALERGGEVDSARKYFAVALGKHYNKNQAAKQQFEFDLRHSSGRAAVTAYRAFREEGLQADPFSFHRLRLFFLHPLQPIALRDLGGLALLLLMLAGLALAPYLWVLPLHYLGQRWFAKGRPPATSRFTFKHFWICSSAFFMAIFLASGFFQHGLIEETLGLISHFGAEELPSDWENALFFLTFTVLTGLFTLVFCVRTRAMNLFKNKVEAVQVPYYVLGALALIFVVRHFNLAVFPELVEDTKSELLHGSVVALLKSSVLTLGLAPTLLLVAVLVPWYEEVLFRGVFLESVGRYFPFWIVNGVQALAFAALHGSLRLLPTFFIMGLAFGWLARKTGSLFVPILAHGANNLVATATLWWALERLGKLQ